MADRTPPPYLWRPRCPKCGAVLELLADGCRCGLLYRDIEDFGDLLWPPTGQADVWPIAAFRAMEPKDRRALAKRLQEDRRRVEQRRQQRRRHEQAEHAIHTN